MKLAAAPCSLHVVCGARDTACSAGKRLRKLVQGNGLPKGISRVLAHKLLGTWQLRNECRELEKLLDGEHLRAWWRCSGIEPVLVPHLNHTEARLRIA